jgi:hypothetical protein
MAKFLVRLNRRAVSNEHPLLTEYLLEDLMSAPSLLISLVLTLFFCLCLPAASDLRANGHCLTSSNGSPFFFLGDTEWRLTSHADSRVIQILDDRRAKSFSVILMGIGQSTPDANGNIPFINNSPTQLNSAYWNRIGWLADRCAERGLHLLIVYGHPGRTDRPDLPVRVSSNAQAYEYGRLVGSALRSKSNIIFSNGFDCDAYSGIGPTGWRAIAEGTADGVNGVNGFNNSADYSTTMMTFHGYSIQEAFHFDSWLDFYGQEVWHNNSSVYPTLNRGYNLGGPIKPSLLLEGTYEDEASGGTGAPTTPHYVRVDAYSAIFAGVSGYCYGHKDSWQQYTSVSYLSRPASGQMGIMARFMKARTWWTLIPDQGVIASGGGTADIVRSSHPSQLAKASNSTLKMALKSPDGTQCYVYFPVNSVAGIRLDRITTSSTVVASWMDPRNGVIQSAGSYGRTQIPNFQPPTGWEDGLLILAPGVAAANTPPTVSVTGPANGSNFTAPANITVSANASDSNGTVSKVDFYRNGVLIGTDTTSPYALAMSSLAAGSYSLSAKATDNAGAATTSAAISITATTTGVVQLVPPTITAPANGAIVSGTSATVSWNAVSGAAGYLLRCEDLSGTTPLDTRNTWNGTVFLYIDKYTATSITLKVVAGHSYRFWIHSAKSNFSYADSTTWSAESQVRFSMASGATAPVNGLTGQYFDNSNFTGATLTRTDATVNFDWVFGSPASSIGVDTFSARWTGQVQPQYSQTYTFFVTGDDGVRLWVNGIQLVDKWQLQNATEYSGSIVLTAGTKYDIKLEYYENLGYAVSQLRWSSASTPKAIIPSSRLYPTVVVPSGTG